MLTKIKMRIIIILILLRVMVMNCFTKDMPDQVKLILQRMKNFNVLVAVFNLEKKEAQYFRRNFNYKEVTLNDEHCAPRPVVMEVKQPNDPSSFYYPYFVTLYQCGGSCGENPFGSACVYSVQESVQVRLAEISWSRNTNNANLLPKITHMEFQNDTQCVCQCKSDKNACSRFQYWDETSCKCRCFSGCPAQYITDPNLCCICPGKMTCPKRQMWDEEKCGCVCKKRTCKNMYKVRNPISCKCNRCNPLIYCRYGSELNKQTCQCEERNNIKR